MRIKQLLESIAEKLPTRPKQTEFPIGIGKLDYKMWLRRGTINIVAARPSNCKTSFAMNNIAFSSALNKKKVIYFSWEDGEEILGDRLIAYNTNIINQSIHHNELTEEHYYNIKEFASGLEDIDLEIENEGKHILSAIKEKITKDFSVTKKYYDMVVIDYVNTLDWVGTGLHRKDAISEFVNSCSQYAKQINACFVICCQINREAMGEGNARTIHPPQNHHIKDCGDIEQVADVIMLLHYNYKYSHDDKEKNNFQIAVSKNKHGDTGNILCHVTPELNKIF